MRAHGALAVRRGESDRDALRLMRETVRNNDLLGLFVEGTRQKAGVPGEAKSGAAMVAIQEGVPVVPAAIHGSQYWKWNRAPVSIAFGEPMRFDELPRNGHGYKQATAEIQDEILRLWRFLVRCTSLVGRTRFRRTERQSPPKPDDRAPPGDGRRRRLPERRQVDARQPPFRDPRGCRLRDSGRDARPQGD